MLFSEIESISIKRRSSKFMTKRRSKRLKAQMVLAVMRDLEGEDDKNPKYIFTKILQKTIFKGKDTGLGRVLGGFLTGITPSNLVEILEIFYDLITGIIERKKSGEDGLKVSDDENENEGNCAFPRIYYALSEETNNVTDHGLKVYKTDENEEKPIDELCGQKDKLIKEVESQIKNNRKNATKCESKSQDAVDREAKCQFVKDRNKYIKKIEQLTEFQKKLEKRLKDCPKKGILEKVTDFFKSVWKKFKKKISEIKISISNIFLPVYSKVKNGIIAVKDYFDCLINKNVIVQTILSYINIEEIVEEIFEALNLESIYEKLKKYFEKLSEIFETGKLVYEIVTASLNGKWMEFKEKISYLLGSIGKFILDTYLNYEKFVNSLTEGVLEFLQLPMIEGLIDMIKGSEKDKKKIEKKEFSSEQKDYNTEVYGYIKNDESKTNSVEGSLEENYTFNFTKGKEIENEYLNTKIKDIGDTKGEYYTSFVSSNPEKDTIVLERSK
jgi:hypothetical protein